MIYDDDALTILLLCSHLGLPADPQPAPLRLREWNWLARQLQAAALRPGALLDMPEAERASQLSLPGEEADRLRDLLARGGALAIELERLESLGIRAMTRSDEDYPKKYRERLKESAPPLLFFAGDRALLGQPGIAVVGSRNLDEAGQACAEFIGHTCGYSGLVLYSGGARGVDTIGMNTALEARGQAVGILADSLERAIRKPEQRAAISRGDLCLATPYTPSAGFSVGGAMGRNKLIYALADYAIVVASEAGKGGTWAGASEALKGEWLPVFVLEHPAMPEGNRLLLEKGAAPFPYPFSEHYSKLPAWLQEHAGQGKSEPKQLGLF